MNACRMEKGYRHWGHDIYDHITPTQAGLGFAIAKQKDNFIGKAALKSERPNDEKTRPPCNHQQQCTLYDPRRAGIPRRQGRGTSTSAAWGHRVDKSLAIAELTHAQG